MLDNSFDRIDEFNLLSLFLSDLNDINDDITTIPIKNIESDYPSYFPFESNEGNKFDKSKISEKEIKTDSKEEKYMFKFNDKIYYGIIKPHVSSEDIKSISDINIILLLYNIEDQFKNNSYLKDIERKTKTKKKIKRKKLYTLKVELRTLMGRKKMDIYEKRNHNKYSSDNLSKKVKTKLLEYCFKFLNKNLISYSGMFDEGKKNTIDISGPLKSLSQIFTNKINRNSELYFLQLTLKEIFSNEISPKFSNYNKDYNKKIIQEIENYENYDDCVKFALNLKFGDWLDVFTYKKELKDIKNYNEETMGKIKNNFERADILIKEMAQNDIYDKKYLTCFICFLLNYERYFIYKQGRRERERKVENEK